MVGSTELGGILLISVNKTSKPFSKSSCFNIQPKGTAKAMTRGDACLGSLTKLGDTPLV